MIERFKSGVLTVLVITSLLLTWQLWTYQPDYAELEKAAFNEIGPIGEQKEIKEVIYPEQMIFHGGGTQSLVDGNEELFEDVYSDLLDARFEDLTVRTNMTTEELYQESEAIEIIFPVNIPGSVLEEIFQFENDNAYVTIHSADRLLLIDEGEDGDQLKVRFVSYHEQTVLEGYTNFSVSDFHDLYLAHTYQYPTVFSMEMEEQSYTLQPNLYLPVEPVEYNKISYTSSNVGQSEFLQILFNDPSYVRKYTQGHGETTYTDGNRMMKIEDNGDHLNYVNPLYSESADGSQSHIVKTTFDFINSHGGWTDSYHLYDWGKDFGNDDAEYRMVVRGIPVFNENGRDLSTIDVERVGNQVSLYNRPLYDLDKYPIDAQETIELPSGQTVIQFIEENLPFAPSDVDNIRVGYQLDKQNLILTFEPQWFIKHNHSWYPIDGDVISEREA